MSYLSFPASFYDAAYDGAAALAGRLTLHFVVDCGKDFAAEELKKAIEKTARDYPVLDSFYLRGFFRDRWAPRDDGRAGEILAETGRAGSSAETEKLTREVLRLRIDPLTQRPWRVTKIPREGGCRLVFTFLHQAADGAGSLTAINRLAKHLTGGEVPPPEPGAMDRGTWQVVRTVKARQVPRLLLETAIDWLRPLALLPFLAKTGNPDMARLPGDYIPFHSLVRLDIGPDSVLGRIAAETGATINDAMVALMMTMVKNSTSRGMAAGFFTVNLRRFLAPHAERVANLSSINTVVLPRGRVTAFPETMRHVSAKIGEQKALFAGVPFIMVPSILGGVLPHGPARIVIDLLLRYARLALTRGLIVTNLGALDTYLEPFGEAAGDAYLIGPFIPAMQIPLVTVTGFRGRASICVCGCDGPDGEITRKTAAGLESIAASQLISSFTDESGV